MTKDKEIACSSCGLTMDESKKLAEAPPSTPSSQWRANGEPDPHGDTYACERAKLTLGHLTDDELANGAFLNYNTTPALSDLLSGRNFGPIVWMTAVKERIRWLSRALEAEQARVENYKGLCAAAYQMAGAANAPVRFLDALSDAAEGMCMEDAVEHLLPVQADEFDPNNWVSDTDEEPKEQP